MGESARGQLRFMSGTSIQRSYDLSSASYARYADRLVYRHLAEPLARALTGSDPVVDVCSGTGALARRLVRAVAVDLSRAQLTHNPVSSRVQADAVRLPFPDDAFGAAGCAFGISHVPEPLLVVREMARLAPLVGVLTWERPAEPFTPKQVVLQIIERHLGSSRSPTGERIDEWTEAVGSESAVRNLLQRAGLETEVRTVGVSVPWPGAHAFVEYRLSLLGIESLLGDPRAVRGEAVAAVEALPATALVWRPRLVLGVGRRFGT